MYCRWVEIFFDVEVWVVNYLGCEFLYDQFFVDFMDVLVELILENFDVFKVKLMVLYGYSFGVFVVFDCVYKF